MKKIGVWNYYEVFNTNNYLLLNKDAGIGDNLLEPFNRLTFEILSLDFIGQSIKLTILVQSFKNNFLTSSLNNSANNTYPK
jgi:hypothetical protein